MNSKSPFPVRLLCLGIAAALTVAFALFMLLAPDAPRFFTASREEHPTLLTLYDGPKTMESSKTATITANGHPLFVYDVMVNHEHIWNANTVPTDTPITYFDFDGEVYRLHVETDNDLTLRRKEPNDGTEFFGRYIMESGKAYDQLKQGYENRAAEVGDDATFDESGIELEMDISEEGTVIVVMKEVGEVTSENTIHMVIDKEEADLEFTLDGDTMELAHSNGKTKTLTRVK